MGYHAWSLKESDTAEHALMHNYSKCSLNGYYNCNHYIITQPAYADSLEKPSRSKATRSKTVNVFAFLFFGQ